MVLNYHKSNSLPNPPKNKFRYYLSYLITQNIEQTSSQWNPVLEINLANGRYRLDTQNATYSYEDRYKSFDTAFRAMQLPPNTLKEVLVLGFGLGSIPYLLEFSFDQSAQYTGVDIDTEVIRLARKYMEPSLLSKTELIAQDALEYVQNAQQKFDLIACDIFIDIHTPAKFFELSFLRALNRLMDQNAYMVFSMLIDSAATKKKAEDFHEQKLSLAFDHINVVDSSGNCLFICECKNRPK